MPNINLRNKVATFLTCELDCNSGKLSVNNVQQKLEPMVHQFLLLLIAHQGELVSKDVVIDTLWPSKKPTDEAVRAMVKKAREALKDNARSPLYIKTVPTKGYLLIPPVDLASTLVKTWLQLNPRLALGFGLAVTILMVVALWYIFTDSTGQNKQDVVVIKKSNVSVVNNDDVSAYYINGALNNIWVSESSSETLNQVNVENTINKRHQKVVFNSALDSDFWYSQGSQRLMVTRSDVGGFYSIEFNRQGTQPNIFEYKGKLTNDLSILALDFTGNYLFVRSASTSSLGLFDLESGLLQDVEELPSAIKHVSLLVQNMSDDANQENGGKLGVKVWPSPVSGSFVMYIESPLENRLLYFRSLADTKASGDINVPNGLHSGVWNQQGTRFTFTDDNASLMAFQTNEARLTSFNTNGELINHVVADCGVSCFVVANTLGVPKLSESVMPSAEGDGVIPRANVSKYAQFVTTNTIARNEYLPYYTQLGLYFVSLKDDKASIVFRDGAHQEIIVHEFTGRSVVEELVVDANDNFVAGIVNKRPFIINLNTSVFRFVPLSFPVISHVKFSEPVGGNPQRDGNDAVLAFHAPAISAGQINNARQPSGLYEYKWATGEVDLVQANAKAKQFVELVDTPNNGSKHYKATFVLGNEGTGTLSFQNNRPALNIAMQNNDCISCWQIKGNYLYELAPNSQNVGQAHIVQTHLLTGEKTKLPLLFNDLLQQFSIHPSLNKVVVTTRQSLQTELTKVEGMSQVY